MTRTFLMVLLLSASSLIVSAADADHIKDMKVDDANGVITLFMDDDFASQEFTEKSIRKIYKRVRKDLRKALPKECRGYDVVIKVHGRDLESMISGAADVPGSSGTSSPKPSRPVHHGGWWDEIAYTGKPWVRNMSRPLSLASALNGKHISLWASHGRFYDVAKEIWRWQRPQMFCTCEDLFTQTIVVPYLMPMLESAGANVFTPRERDWQTEEVIVDNVSPGYRETVPCWSTPSVAGFAMPAGVLSDGENPFDHGTVRQMASSAGEFRGEAIYQPRLNKAGRYAVYVSYATVEGSSDEVTYSVIHKGQRTDYAVNQQMGGGTWVYLGTFDFDAGYSLDNSVIVSTKTPEGGIITTDAVRFGGGMGNIERGGVISGVPRCLEGARYYAQWAGAPYSAYSVYAGADDYKDDINVRSLMTNWLGGGSPYMPNKEGRGVPIDLTLAIHSDAGYNTGMEGVFGSLAVCTTDFNDGKVDAGISRDKSRMLCEDILAQSKRDLAAHYGSWVWRDLYDRNYSESRLPAVPSAIFETLSHQSFPDMRLAHDPDFKFTLARSIYKTLLRYEAKAHGEKAVVMPLPPTDFHISLDTLGVATLSWKAQHDNLEPSAAPASYVVYQATGSQGFDNGTMVRAAARTEGHHHAVTLHKTLLRDVLYRFRITAANKGGESFPTEELCVLWHGKGAPTVMVVNAFQRLSSPAVVDSVGMKGFDIDADPGVSYGLTAGWGGRQQVFSTATMGREGPGTFAYSGNEMVGHFVMGNTFDYVTEHARAISTAGRYNIVSASRRAIEDGGAPVSGFAMVDVILGNERDDGHSLKPYKTFTPLMQRRLREYATHGGAILVSGSYTTSDMLASDEKDFMGSVLHCVADSTITIDNGMVKGLGRQFDVINTLNADHYASTRSDCLKPAVQGSAGGSRAFTAMQYANGRPAAVACTGPAPTFVMGFPLECIKSAEVQGTVMRGILSFLTGK